MSPLEFAPWEDLLNQTRIVTLSFGWRTPDSMREIGDYFGWHYSRVSRIVRGHGARLDPRDPLEELSIIQSSCVFLGRFGGSCLVKRSAIFLVMGYANGGLI